MLKNEFKQQYSYTLIQEGLYKRGMGMVKSMMINLRDNYYSMKVIKEEKKFSYFDLRTAKSFFLYGIIGQDDDHDYAEKFDDFYDIQYKQGIKLHSIQFLRFANVIYGYKVEYLDYLNNIYSYVRLQSNSQIINDLSNSSKFILKPFENIIDIEISFTYEQLSSVLLRTSLDREHMFGKKAQHTSVCKLRGETTENNIIFGFSGTILSGSIKEIHVIRGLVLQTERQKPIVVTASQFFIEKHKNESKDPHQYIKKIIEAKKQFIRDNRQQKQGGGNRVALELSSDIQVSDVEVFNEEQLEQLDFIVPPIEKKLELKVNSAISSYTKKEKNQVIIRNLVTNQISKIRRKKLYEVSKSLDTLQKNRNKTITNLVKFHHER